MSHLKNEFTADLLLWVMANEPKTPLYFGFLCSNVSDDKDPAVHTKEVADPTYARQLARFTPVEKGFVRLTHDLNFPRASRRWDRVTHFAIFDAPKNGNLLLLKTTGGVTTVEALEIVTVLTAEFNLYVGEGVVASSEMGQ